MSQNKIPVFLRNLALSPSSPCCSTYMIRDDLISEIWPIKIQYTQGGVIFIYLSINTITINRKPLLSFGTQIPLYVKIYLYNFRTVPCLKMHRSYMEEGFIIIPLTSTNEIPLTHYPYIVRDTIYKRHSDCNKIWFLNVLLYLPLSNLNVVSTDRL